MKSLLFVDDEDRVLQGLQRQLRSMRNDWDMRFANSGARALELLSASPADVLVTDMMMPGMDGAQLLSEVLKRYPNTVRLVLSGHCDRESVFRLVGPAHQYLTKPCDGEELRVAIARAFALRELLTNETLKQLATRINCLPSLPTLHTQLTKEFQNDEPSVERIAEIISKDIGMTAKILQLVNSAFFGLPQPVTNPSEAVIYLGLATVRALVLSVQVFAQFDQKTIQGFSIEDLAQHCWMTGNFARQIADAERCDPKVGDQCFLAGMLHDVGRLMLASGLPEEYSRVTLKARETSQPVWMAERDLLGATHAELGAYLLGIWGLPNPVIEAVALHHRPADAPSKSFSPTIAVHIADALAHGQNGAGHSGDGVQIDIAQLAAIGLANRLDVWKQRCHEDGS